MLFHEKNEHFRVIYTLNDNYQGYTPKIWLKSNVAIEIIKLFIAFHSMLQSLEIEKFLQIKTAFIPCSNETFEFGQKSDMPLE